MADARTLPEKVLDCVASIPSGKVMTYGDVAEYCDSRAARMVGRVLARSGGPPANESGGPPSSEGVAAGGVAGGGGHDGLPWHRVLRADGTLAEHLYTEQRQRLLSEGVRFRGDRVDLKAHRWDGRPG